MRCENCQAEIGFWTALRQSIPYRLQCFQCNARYRVSAPFLSVLFIAAVFIFAGLLPVFKAGFEEFGPFFIAPFAAFTIGVWFVIEFILYRYIAGRGRLTRIDKTGQESVNPAEGSTGE
ncbi:MAG TPA: hypothetical protein PLA83_07225 [Deltaproteobacteria bacterium]|nr:hypothetical protein [Deltaproteobacteria bacterium]HQI00702.1 hypothetical protein [Deltaproteobacteria bacterium]HQJ09591.1 hypothetical protein [Deltaproteobacteria bacterium]